MKTIIKVLKKLARFLIDRYIMFRWRRRKIRQKSDHSSYNELEFLVENGVVKINYDFSEFADYIFYNYTDRILNNKKIEQDVYSDNNDSNENGTTLQVDLSLNDKTIVDFILNDKIFDILFSYYGREYFLRNNPTLQQIIAKKENWASSIYHHDRFHQVSLMLLLTDLTEDDSHMEYLCGTQKLKFYEWLHLEYDHPNLHEKVKKCKNRFKLIGKKGTAFLFDSIGIHRSLWKLNTERNVLFLNFTAGHNLYAFKDQELIISKLSHKNCNIIKREKGTRIFVSPEHYKFAYLKQYKNFYIG